MLTKEFAQEVAQLVFDMLEAKWEAKRLATAERKAEEARQKELEKQRKLEERSKRVPAKAQDMINALAQAMEENGGLPVPEWRWREVVAASLRHEKPMYVRVLFHRYRQTLEMGGHIRYENGLYSVTGGVTENVTNVTNAT